VSRRYEKGAILLTSNRSVGEWGTVFGDPVVGDGHSRSPPSLQPRITIRDDSYRLKEKHRSGLLQKAATTEGKAEKNG
jgi:DNA replication protein DnaC